MSKEQANRAEVTAWLEPPRDNQLNNEMASPTVDYPSDHYALAYEVELKPPLPKFPRFDFMGELRGAEHGIERVADVGDN